METGILISGTGGQGIVRAGEFLSEALFRAGYQVINTRSYGSEARGGRCRSEVIASDSEIYDLQIREPDILVVLSAPAFKQYLDDAKTGALVLVDSEILEEACESDVRSDLNVVPVPATDAAVRLGNPIVANMVLLGALAKRTELLSLERLKDTAREMMRPSMREINVRALEAGYAEA